MGKMYNMILLTIVIDIGLIIFAGTSTNQNAFFVFFLDPTSWSSNPLFTVIETLAVGIGVAGLIIGTLFFKSDFVVFAGFVGTLLTFGGAAILPLYLFVKNVIPASICNPPTSIYCTSTPLQLYAAGLIVGPLTLYYVLTALNYWRKGDD